MNMPKSRELHAKIPSPKAIFIGFLPVRDIFFIRVIANLYMDKFCIGFKSVKEMIARSQRKKWLKGLGGAIF